MEKKVKTTEIHAREFYGDNCLIDSMQEQSGERRPKGVVEVYEEHADGKMKLVRKSNLVIYLGREMLAQRLVDTENPNATPTKDEFVTWFGLGDGGVRPADPFDPVPPTLNDGDLYPYGMASNVMINATDASSADYHIVAPGYPEEGYYKRPFDSIVFERDVLNDSKWLVMKITTTIGVSDANGKQLSEAGLFSAESRDGGYSGQFSLFARVTFPSMVKTVERRLVFIWYLYV
jgi:hypothetical protein